MYTILAILIPLILLMQPTSMRYVAPDGAGADCSQVAPCSLATALAAGGDIWLELGTYAGDIRIDTPNTTLRGDGAILDGDVQVWAEDVTIDGLELTYTGWPSRVSAYPGSAPPDVEQKALSIYGKRARILNCYIHDLAGVGFWQTSTDSEMRGNLILNNGWRGTDRGHGPSIYAQNKGDGDKLIADNVIGPSYSMTGFEFYGSHLASLKRFHIERNVLNGVRFLHGGGTPVDDAHVISNLLWKSSIEVGYTNPLNGSAEIRDNYVGYGHILPHKLAALEMIGNTVINYGGLAVMDLTKTISSTYTIDSNTYLSNRSFVHWNDGTLQDFTTWQASGYDVHGAFGPLPVQPRVFARDTYVAIYNWNNAATLPAPIAGRYTNALNPAESITLAAGAALPMTGWTVATPIGANAPLVGWDRQFTVFMVSP